MWLFFPSPGPQLQISAFQGEFQRCPQLLRDGARVVAFGLGGLASAAQPGAGAGSDLIQRATWHVNSWEFMGFYGFYRDFIGFLSWFHGILWWFDSDWTNENGEIHGSLWLFDIATVYRWYI